MARRSERNRKATAPTSPPPPRPPSPDSVPVPQSLEYGIEYRGPGWRLTDLADHLSSVLFDPSDLKSIVAVKIPENIEFAVLRVGERWLSCPFASIRSVYVHDLWVHGAYRNRGVGQGMIQHVIDSVEVRSDRWWSRDDLRRHIFGNHYSMFGSIIAPENPYLLRPNIGFTSLGNGFCARGLLAVLEIVPSSNWVIGRYSGDSVHA